MADTKAISSGSSRRRSRELAGPSRGPSPSRGQARPAAKPGTEFPGYFAVRDFLDLNREELKRWRFEVY